MYLLGCLTYTLYLHARRFAFYYFFVWLPSNRALYLYRSLFFTALEHTRLHSFMFHFHPKNNNKNHPSGPLRPDRRVDINITYSPHLHNWMRRTHSDVSGHFFGLDCQFMAQTHTHTHNAGYYSICCLRMRIASYTYICAA